MTPRHPVLRMLVMIGAAVQLLSPGAAAVADGLLATANASQPLTHIEATTTAKCPVVHAPDCGVCRYLSSSSTLARAVQLVPLLQDAPGSPNAIVCAPASITTSLRRSRAPPPL
jgi:hypothetical protein